MRIGQALRLATLAICASVGMATCTYAGEHEQSILEYGDQCAKEIGEICPFDCNSGTDIPVTVDNQTPASDAKVDQCDRPSLLDPKNPGQGQCVQYSKVLNLSRGSTQISVYCRRLKVRPRNDPYYDEVDIVLHHTGNGKTCWFQSKAPPSASVSDTKNGANPKYYGLQSTLRSTLQTAHTAQSSTSASGASAPTGGIDASRVPPPNERQAPAGHPSAVEFWESPHVVAQQQCATCHDAGPYIQSPFIAQVWDKVPTDPWGKYVNIGADFASWRHSWSISTTGNTCVGCHRIGDEQSCSTYIPMSAGKMPSPAEDKLATSFAMSHWMPLNSINEGQWNADNLRSLDALNTCCSDPNHRNPMCHYAPIMTSPDPHHDKVPDARERVCPVADRSTPSIDPRH